MSLLTINLLRHGLTQSNVEGRFGGTAESVITKEGWQELYDLKEQYGYPSVDCVYTSPAIRTRETAYALFPEHQPIVLEGLWEYKFGKMEGHFVSEFIGTDLYKKWLRQDPDCAFEGGETMLEAAFRVRAALTRIIKESEDAGRSSIAVIAHGEILNLLLQHTLISDEPDDAFLLCPNGMGLCATVDTQAWFKDQKMHFQHYLPQGAPRLKPEDSPFFKSALEDSI